MIDQSLYKWLTAQAQLGTPSISPMIDSSLFKWLQNFVSPPVVQHLTKTFTADTYISAHIIQSLFSMSFDGTNYASTNADFPLTGNPDFSISLWLNMRGGVSPLGFGGVSVSLDVCVFSFGFRGTNIMSLEFGGGNGAWTNQPISLNHWHHLCWTKSSGPINTTTNFYLDGVQGTIQAGASTGTPNIGSGKFFLGKSLAGGLADCSLDGVRIYDRVLSSPEVGDLANAINPMDSPYIWWGFEENDTGTITDSSGNNFDGTISLVDSSPTWSSPSPLTGSTHSLAFDASTRQYVETPNISTFDTNNKWTLAYWVNVASVSDSIGIEQGPSFTQEIELLHHSTGDIFCLVCNGGTTYGRVGTSWTGWHHLAMVYDGTGSTNDDKLKCYIDGTAQTLTFDGTTIPTTSDTHFVSPSFVSTPLRFGRRASEQFGVGKIDDVRIYGRCLTPIEAGQLGVGTNPTINDPIHWWKLDDGTGDRAIDTNGGLDAILGGTWNHDVPPMLQ